MNEKFLIAIAIAAAAFVAGFTVNGWRLGNQIAALNTAIDKQKIESGEKLNQETDKVRTLESKLSTLLAEQNTKDAQNEKTTSDLTKRLADLGRLRDPKAGRGSSCSSPQAPNIATTDNRTDDRSEASGLLSAETSDDLRTLTREADAVNIAYTSCRADALNLRAQLK